MRIFSVLDLLLFSEMPLRESCSFCLLISGKTTHLFHFPGESACSSGDMGSIPGSERSPREGNSNPLQYSGLENLSMDCIAREVTESDMTERFSLFWGDTGALRFSGKTSWKKTQQVQGSWDRTRWAEAPSCIHSLGAGEGTHKWSRAPTEGCGKPGGTGAPLRSGRERQGPPFCVLGHCSWLWDRGTSVNRQTGVRKDPTEPAQLDTEWVWGRAGKADGGRRSLFEELELLP